MIDKFMGHGIDYWITMEKEVQRANTMHLMEEIALLRAKVSFYESRIVEMDRLRVIRISES